MERVFRVDPHLLAEVRAYGSIDASGCFNCGTCTLACDECGETPADGLTLSCPACGRDGVAVKGGDSLRMVSIDID